MPIVFGRQLDSDDMGLVFQAVAEFHAESEFPVMFSFEPNPIQVAPVLGRRALTALTELRASSDHAEEQYQRFMARPVSRQEIPLDIGLILFMHLPLDQRRDSEERIALAAASKGYELTEVQKLSLPLVLPDGVQTIDHKFVRWLANNGIDDVKRSPAPQDVAWTTLMDENRRSEGMFKPRRALAGRISRAIKVIRSGPLELVEVPDTIA